jgi:hypothetical protein
VSLADFVNKRWRQTAGHSLSGGRLSFTPKSRFRRDLVSCWTDSGSLKSTWPFGFRLGEASVWNYLKQIKYRESKYGN